MTSVFKRCFFEYLAEHWGEKRWVRQAIGGAWERWRINSSRVGNVVFWVRMPCDHFHQQLHSLGWTCLEREHYDHLRLISLAQ